MSGLDFSKAVNDKSFPAIVRTTAMELMRAGSYSKVGPWFKSLSDYDLRDLNDVVEQVDAGDQQASDVLVALAMLLSQAEGGTSTTTEEVIFDVQMFTMFLTMESLYRKGLIDLDHALMTFAHDSGALVLAKVRRTVE